MDRFSQAYCTTVFLRQNSVPYGTARYLYVPVRYCTFTVQYRYRTAVPVLLCDYANSDFLKLESHFYSRGINNKQHAYIIYAHSTYCTAYVYLFLHFLNPKTLILIKNSIDLGPEYQGRMQETRFVWVIDIITKKQEQIRWLRRLRREYSATSSHINIRFFQMRHHLMKKYEYYVNSN